MYQAKSGVKKFSLYWGGGSLDKKIFFQSEHVSSQIWCQKNFPLLGGGVPRQKNFFSSLNMYQAKSGVKNFSPLLKLGPPLPPPPPPLLHPRLDEPTQKSETWDPPPPSPLPPIQGWISIPENLRPGTPPPYPRLDQPIRKSETWDPPPKC